MHGKAAALQTERKRTSEALIKCSQNCVHLIKGLTDSAALTQHILQRKTAFLCRMQS